MIFICLQLGFVLFVRSGGCLGKHRGRKANTQAGRHVGTRQAVQAGKQSSKKKPKD